LEVRPPSKLPTTDGGSGEQTHARRVKRMQLRNATL
jgi:hypothetical protein